MSWKTQECSRLARSCGRRPKTYHQIPRNGQNTNNAISAHGPRTAKAHSTTKAALVSRQTPPHSGCGFRKTKPDLTAEATTNGGFNIRPTNSHTKHLYTHGRDRLTIGLPIGAGTHTRAQG